MSSIFTNLEPKEIVRAEDRHNGVYVVLNVFKWSNNLEIAFYSSRHVWGVYQSPPTLQLTSSVCLDAPEYGFAVDAKSIEKFAKSNEHFCRTINENSEFEYDEHQNATVRTMNELAEEALEDLEAAFEEYLESFEFVDHGVEVLDCEDFWTPEALRALFEPWMDYDDFEFAVSEAQKQAQNEDLHILGELPECVIEEVFVELRPD